MCNQTITLNDNTTQTEFALDVKEVKKLNTKRTLAPTFKPYNNRQIQMIFNIEDHIPPHHISRVVDEMIESLSDSQLFAYYTGGGRSSYHPKMMLKVILYSYSQKVYSCRGIEKLIQENLPAMWLAGMLQPDFRTLNEFRGQRMKSMIDELFEEMTLKLIEGQYISMENYFLDGTKIEANANKYSFVWKKSTERFQKQLKIKIQETLKHIEEITNVESANLQDDEVSSEQLENIANQLDVEAELLTQKISEETDVTIRKEKRQKRSQRIKFSKQIKEDFIPRMIKYDEQKNILGERNSYSKTDHDATFMRMKEDHMKNGQLKPGYNVQMATGNQFVLYYTIHQRPTDTRCFIPHIEKLMATGLPTPKTVIADAGYGSEENYLFSLGEENKPKFDFLIPYGTYEFEQTRKYKKDIKNTKNWGYHELDDFFVCPNGRKVKFKKYMTKKNASGFKQDFKIYECEDCTDCPLKAQCTKAKGNRQIHWNPVFEEMKAKAKAALECEEKSAIYRQRKIDVESVFGHIKGNRSFRRFSLRGIDKVHTEFGIVALAHNLLKVAAIRLFDHILGTKKSLSKNLFDFQIVIFMFCGTY